MISHIAESQSDCRDHQGFQNGYKRSVKARNDSSCKGIQDSLGFWIPETYLRSSSFVVAAQSVSYHLIYYLARGLGKNWRDLGRTLGISVRKLSEIDRKTELLDHEKGMTMLQEWKVRLGDDATVEVLQDALKDLGIKDPALKLKAGM